jgi:hypothetical protein
MHVGIAAKCIYSTYKYKVFHLFVKKMIVTTVIMLSALIVYRENNKIGNKIDFYNNRYVIIVL